MERGAGITAEQVHCVLDALEDVGCWVSLEGGWGVDALVRHQTRPHRDLDIGIDAAHEAAALAALERLGYEVETDWRPNRVELMAPRRGWVDVHPLTSDAEGNRYQLGLDGERYPYPAASFVTGHILRRAVRCLSAAQQLEWHHGYQPRDTDHADLVLLRELARREQRPAIPAPPVDRHVLATGDDVIAARRNLRILAERHGVTGPRVTPAGAVLVGIPDDPGYAALKRFAAEAAHVVGARVNVAAEGAPWTVATDTTPL